MSNYRRVFVPGGRYFFTLVTWERRTILSSPHRIELLRSAFREVAKKRPFETDAIVVLPDHLHCIWRLPPGDADFSSRWREIKKHVTRRLDLGPIKEPVWQPRFWEHYLRSEEDWRRHVDYIHFNPVKHGLVERVSDWPYSSFHAAVRRGLYELDWGFRPTRQMVEMDRE